MRISDLQELLKQFPADTPLTELPALILKEREKYRQDAIHFAEEADHFRARVMDLEEAQSSFYCTQPSSGALQ